MQNPTNDRYIPTGTTVVAGIRESFPADYPFVAVRGKGALASCPTPAVGEAKYAPCFGGKKNKALKV